MFPRMIDTTLATKTKFLKEPLTKKHVVMVKPKSSRGNCHRMCRESTLTLEIKIINNVSKK
jgi:hypothetical protein